MGVVLRMTAKDLLRRRRTPLSLILTLAFPILFALILAVVFGTGEPEIPKVHLLIEDRDGGLAGGLLRSAFGNEQAARYFVVEEVGPEGETLMEKGKASALLRIPEGFSRSLIDGKPTRLEVIRNPAQAILPEAAEQTVRILAEILSGASRVLRQPLETLAPLLEDDVEAPSDETISEIAVQFNRTITAAGDYVLPPVITLEGVTLTDPDDASGGGSDSRASIFLLILPGVSVFALFMIGDLAMRDVMIETEAGTLRRQLSGPVGAGAVVASKALQTAVISTASLVLLTLTGWFVADRPIDVVAFVLLSLSVILAVTGAAAAIYGFARTQGQAATFASVVFLVMAFAGGSFMPEESLPAALRAVSPYSLFYWGVRGYRNVIHGGAGVADVLLHIGVLATIGVSLLVLGVFLLRQKVRRGALA